MALKPYTDRQKTLIVNNVVAACRDISKLNNTGYKFINQACGFIAHYNLYGFRDAYRVPGTLTSDILRYAHMNHWDNFRPSDPDYAYYMDKRDIYNRIVAQLRERFW